MNKDQIKKAQKDEIMNLNLQYFTNNNDFHKIVENQTDFTKYYSNEDYKFYRKQAFELTKNMFHKSKKKDYSNDVNQAFDQFLGKVFEYLKTQDMTEFYQNDLKEKEENDKNKIDTGIHSKHHTYFVESQLRETNALMMRDYNVETNPIDDSLGIVKKKIFIKEEKPILPKQKKQAFLKNQKEKMKKAKQRKKKTTIETINDKNL